MKKLIVVVMTMGVALVAATAALANDNHPPAKIKICHVAGLASDPANYITLELPPQAVYGNGGHFNEDGTPQAGHEQDSFGACNPPPPPFDQCDNIPGDQPEGTVCFPEEPPFDQCENLPGNQPEGTVCETTPPVTPPERCEPPNPDGTYGGKDGKPGNDECKADEVPPVTTTPPDVPKVVTPLPGVTPSPTPEKPKEKVAPKPKKKAKAKPVSTPKPDAPSAAKDKVATSPTVKETLPYTGAPTGLLVLAGSLLVGIGAALRRLS